MKLLALALAACAPNVYRVAHTEDRLHLVEVVDGDHQMVVQIDGAPGEGHDAVAAASLVSRGGHVAFAAQDQGQWYVFADGNRGPRWDGISDLALGPTGERAYFAEKDGGWYAVIGGKISARLDALRSHSLVFSLDGKRHGYAGDAQGRVYVVVDGVVGPAFTAVTPLQFSADGARAVYAGKRDDGWHVVVDGVAGPAWVAIGAIAPSPRGGRVAYTAWDGNAWRVVTDDDPGPSLDRIARLRWRDDGSQLAWLARLGGNDVLALDGAPVATAPRLPDRFAFAPGGALVHVAQVRGGQQLVAGDQAGPIYDEVGQPVFSPRGKLAYPARRGAGWVVVVDGRERGGGEHVGELVWSADERLGYVAIRAGRTVAVVDAQTVAFDLAFEDTLAFSDDGAHWSVVAGALRKEQLFFAIDGAYRVPIDPREIYSAGPAADPALLRTWSRAEANRAGHAIK